MSKQSQFLKLLSDIEPSRTTKSNCVTAHTNLRSFLKNHTTYKDIHLDTMLSGSYRRETAIRPKAQNGVIKRPDVDVVIVTNYDLSDSPSEVIDDLYNVLKDKYFNITKQTRSIGITTANVDMDAVPVIAPYGIDGTWYIADRDLDEWLITNPRGQIEHSTTTNTNNNYRYKPLVKLFKWWRRENPTIYKRPKGYLLELMVAENISKNNSNYAILFTETLESMVDKYSINILLDIVPFIPDPGVPNNSVLNGITSEQFKALYKKIEEHAIISRQALDTEDGEESTKLWKKVFGNEFPVSTSSSNSLYSEQNASTNFNFPNKPLKPNGPNGFGK
ncbi:SMODS domain-containing nucleotidyltransferase [Vagococcus carniphilus]|uniref:SMODS domain-containing nucleotidyltransferase n=1 Tax=Vagococcus carniphilus TaxID=218144 RepID=UPI0028914183|nr:hypothetical protein [Vagococcus carniphilus]MDT2815252.1 hypothetical protein [Vagococcus carniphilus]MDT2866507.1 hypothetical protein [Vagococcus carniphilus]